MRHSGFVAARVSSLHRYPVKSMLGEDVERLVVDERGCAGDRLWSVRTAEGKIGSGKNTRRFAAVPGLLDLRAVERASGVHVSFPDGTSCAVDGPEAHALVSSHLAQAVTLVRETDVSHYDDGPVSILGSASLAALSAERGCEVAAARFRPNVVLDTSEPFVEDGWVGKLVQLGTATLRVTMTSPRCVMVDMPTADLPAQPGNLTAVGRLNSACLGVIATVVVPGTIAVGDRLELR